MPLKPDPLPELPIPNPNDGPWPTFSVSLADRQAMNNGPILPVKLSLAGKVVRSSAVKPLSSKNVGTIGVGWQSSSAPSQQPLTSTLNTYSPAPVGRHIFPTRRLVVLSLIVLTIVGMVAGTWLLLPSILGKLPTGSTPTATATATATATPASPSGLPIDPSAAAVITDAQTSSDIDRSSTRPTHITSTFTTGQLIWVTFNIHFNGQVGTIEAKFYEDNQLIPDFTNTLGINDGNNPYGALFPGRNQTYSTPTQGAAELYWCPQYDCSNEQLAAFVNFIVSNTASSIIGQTILTG